MHWDDVAVFLALAENGRARLAAARLGLSQPTVGRRIERLEQALKTPLFDRTSTGYALTRQGAALLPLAEAMATAARDLQQHPLTDEALAEVEVRVSALNWPAMLLARRAASLRRLQDEAGVRLEIDVSNEAATLSLRQADIAIRHDIPPSGDFVTRKLGEIACAVYGAVDYVAANPAALDERRYAQCDWVAYTHEQAHYELMLWLDRRLQGREPHLRASDTAVIYATVAAGGGLAVLPCFLMADDPRFIQASGVIDGLRSGYSLIVHRQLLRRQPVRHAVDAIVTIFAGLS